MIIENDEGDITRRQEDFAAQSKAWAEALCDSPGGLDLVQMVCASWPLHLTMHVACGDV
jgi:hypothetical protein